MSAKAFDWDSVPTGELYSDGIDFRWRRGSVHVVFDTMLPEVLVFIDRLTLSLLNSDEVRGLVALLKREGKSAFLADGLEIRDGIDGGLSVGGELDAVEIGLSDEEAASVIEGLTAVLPCLEEIEQSL